MSVHYSVECSDSNIKYLLFYEFSNLNSLGMFSMFIELLNRSIEKVSILYASHTPLLFYAFLLKSIVINIKWPEKYNNKNVV